MNKKSISIIFLIFFIIISFITIINVFLEDSQNNVTQSGVLLIDNEKKHYEKVGKCLDVIDGNTIHVYGVGKVQLTQIASPGDDAKIRH